jgi:hypothetical protein
VQCSAVQCSVGKWIAGSAYICHNPYNSQF